MNPTIAQYVLDGNLEMAKQEAQTRHPDAYLEGYKDLKVAWIPKGHQFEITEHDGYESIDDLGPVQYMIA